MCHIPSFTALLHVKAKKHESSLMLRLSSHLISGCDYVGSASFAFAGPKKKSM